MLSCGFCEISKNTFFTEHPRATASEWFLCLQLPLVVTDFWTLVKLGILNFAPNVPNVSAILNPLPAIITLHIEHISGIRIFSNKLVTRRISPFLWNETNCSLKNFALLWFLYVDDVSARALKLFGQSKNNLKAIYYCGNFATKFAFKIHWHKHL